MSHRVFFAYALIAGLLLSGCMGTGEVINLEINPLPTSSSRDKKAPRDESILIVVDAFKDVRKDKKKIGLRTHFWGGITNFNAWKGEIGDGMANLTRDANDGSIPNHIDRCRRPAHSRAMVSVPGTWRNRRVRDP